LWNNDIMPEWVCQLQYRPSKQATQGLYLNNAWLADVLAATPIIQQDEPASCRPGIGRNHRT
jgi:hypothetical protein